MSRKRLGIDFGTSTIKIYENHEGLVLDEKNIIAIYKKKKVLAVGNEAYEMYEKTPEEIRVTYPIRNGVIADIENMRMMIRHFIDSLKRDNRGIKGADYYLAVPTGISEVDARAYQTLVADSKLKAKKIHLIHKPVANSRGLGEDVSKEKGVMIVDIGANTTEISVLSHGGMVVSKLLPIGGAKLDEAITSMIRKSRDYIIGSKTAEFIKKEMASAVPIQKTIHVYGRNLANGLPGKITVDQKDVNDAIKGYIVQIIESIRTILERTPPEIMEGVRMNGIWLTGGSSKINGLSEFIKKETELPVHTCMNPENTVILGLGAIMRNPKEFKGELSWEERRR